MTKNARQEQSRPTPRIFWLGMHKVLVQTEFALLQSMGYQVFRPAYLSNTEDQSVSASPNHGNHGLPEDVLQLLLKENFFYQGVASDTTSLLETYFDLAVVTIHPNWLRDFLLAYSGPVVYRTFGQIGNLSEELQRNGGRELIEARDNFYFMPHAPEVLEGEAPWLTRRATVVPYWLPPEVFAMEGAWRSAHERRLASVALICPNIDNPYYNAHFRYLKRHFEERCFRYYGVQLRPNDDPNVVGTLSRSAQLAALSEESGMLYTYREPNVCYLPPIESMVLGAPVLHFPDSLLARYAGERSPGLVRDEGEAKVAARRLMAGDRVFVGEVVDAQRSIAARYRPSFGEGLFRAEFARIAPIARSPTKNPEVIIAMRTHVLLFAHLDGYVVHMGRTSSVHGIPRVMRQVVKALVDMGCHVTVTSKPHLRPAVLDFYAAGCSNRDRVAVIGTDDLALSPAPGNGYSYAIVPHYHLMPEADELTIPYLLYLPDYLPHYFQGRDWFAEAEDVVSRGRSRASGARRILTNSAFSMRYLPRCQLEVPADRIVHFPLPFLGQTERSEPADLEFQPPPLPNGRFLYYPAQPHPNKRHDLLVLAWVLLNERRSEPLHLVLTAGELPARLIELIDAHGLSERLHLQPGLADASLEWLYTQASCMTIPSEMEGNFPTQVLEALHLGCPIATMDNPLILEELGDLACFFQIAPFGDVQAYADRIEYCLDYRNEVLRLQELALKPLRERYSYERFCVNMRQLNESMIHPELTARWPELPLTDNLG